MRDYELEKQSKEVEDTDGSEKDMQKWPLFDIHTCSIARMRVLTLLFKFVVKPWTFDDSSSLLIHISKFSLESSYFSYKI